MSECMLPDLRLGLLASVVLKDTRNIFKGTQDDSWLSCRC